jgi:hypothetical protein
VWIYLKDVKLYPLSNCLQYKLSQSYIHLHLVILNRNKDLRPSFTSFVRLGGDNNNIWGRSRGFSFLSFWFARWQRMRSFTDCRYKNWQKVEFFKFKRWIVFCFGLICICYVHGYSWSCCLFVVVLFLVDSKSVLICWVYLLSQTETVLCAATYIHPHELIVPWETVEHLNQIENRELFDLAQRCLCNL